MRAYSNDLRQRILQAVDQGRIARPRLLPLFRYRSRRLGAIAKQPRETGRLAVKPIPGRPPKQRAALEADLLAQLAAHDDATVEQHYQLWAAAHGQQVSTATMRWAIARLGWTQKSHWVPPSAVKPPARLGAT